MRRAGALAEPGAVELWAFAGGNLWRAELVVDGEAVLLRNQRKVVVAGRPLESVPVDLVADLPGAALVLVYPDLLLSAAALVLAIATETAAARLARSGSPAAIQPTAAAHLEG